MIDCWFAAHVSSCPSNGEQAVSFSKRIIKREIVFWRVLHICSVSRTPFGAHFDLKKTNFDWKQLIWAVKLSKLIWQDSHFLFAKLEIFFQISSNFILIFYLSKYVISIEYVLLETSYTAKLKQCNEKKMDRKVKIDTTSITTQTCQA